MSYETAFRSPESDDEIQEFAFPKRRCCFLIPNLRSEPSWQRINTASESLDYDPWWFRGWKKLREWSEIVCGPKWKTFIRRFGRNRNATVRAKFQYDPLSYALNFDDGPEKSGYLDEDFVNRNFSARFAVVPASVTTGEGPVDGKKGTGTES